MARSTRDFSSRRQHRRHHRHLQGDSHDDELLRAANPSRQSANPSKSRPKRTRQGKGGALEEDSSTTALSADALGRLDRLNDEAGWSRYDGLRARDTPVEENADLEENRKRLEKKRRREKRRDNGGLQDWRKEKRERRVASGQRLEKGKHDYHMEEVVYARRGKDGNTEMTDEYDEEARRRKRRWICECACADVCKSVCPVLTKTVIIIAVVIVILIVAIAVGVVVSKKDLDHSSTTIAATNSSKPANTNLQGLSESAIPQSAQGTYLDPFTWYDTTDFNVTYTAATAGGLSIMGLNSTWNDSTRANDNVPSLDDTWAYGTMPVRGINLGGWLSIEPVITPSLFSGYTTHDNVIDEWTLSSTLGPTKAKSIIEQHYSSFVTEQTFQDIQASGFDHVRLPFSYWAVTVYDGDPYVPQVAWRYLLRAIEWARRYGLRINLDLHGAPGSQNGWNHSGRQGMIGWLNGTDGATNGQRTLDIHNQLSTFFSQPRYANIIAMYGLVNEPRMTALDVSTVLNWTTSAVTIVRNNGINATIVFGDGFMGLENWQGKLQDLPNLLLDVHQYVIFNVEQLALAHSDKVTFACGGWTAQILASQDTATGFGPTLCGEWSQADTDCALYLNNVGVGSRWQGTLNMADTPGGATNGSVLSPTCPTDNSPQCECAGANADPAQYSAEYKTWLLQFAEAQMSSFEQGWGWFYWTWQMESATQWSYKDGLAAGILPAKTWERSFNCSAVPDYAGLGLPEYY